MSVCTHDLHLVWKGSGVDGYTLIKCHHCDLELTFDDVLRILKMTESLYHELMSTMKKFFEENPWSYNEH